MTFELLETVVLNREVPEHGLRAGDMGAIVHVYTEAAFEVEFVRASGQTKALVALEASDLRSLAANDMLTVRASRERLPNMPSWCDVRAKSRITCAKSQATGENARRSLPLSRYTTSYISASPHTKCWADVGGGE